MSAPLRLNADQLDQVATALRTLTRMRDETTVTVAPQSLPEIGIGDNVLRIRWDEDAEQYVIDDRNGD